MLKGSSAHLEFGQIANARRARRPGPRQKHIEHLLLDAGIKLDYPFVCIKSIRFAECTRYSLRYGHRCQSVRLELEEQSTQLAYQCNALSRPQLIPLITLIAVQVKLNKDEFLYGVKFHSDEADVLVTYGKKHLTLWQLHEDLSATVQQSSLKVCARPVTRNNELTL